MASNPLFIIHTRLFLHFPNELSYGYLTFEGNGKIPQGRQRKRSALLAVSVQQPTGQTFFPTFPGIFPFLSNLRQPQQSSFGKCKKSLVCIMKSGLDAMPLFLLDDLLRQSISMEIQTGETIVSVFWVQWKAQNYWKNLFDTESCHYHN